VPRAEDLRQLVDEGWEWRDRRRARLERCVALYERMALVIDDRNSRSHGM
jgi:hypothetical protein